MANIRSRSGLLWKKWGRECMFFATGFGFLLIVLLPSLNSWKKESDMIPKHFPGTSPGDLVDLTLLQSSKVEGAVCLDGSAPGYHLQRGFGSGSNYWIVHIEGGGWCNTLESCSLRKNTALGSSTFMEKQVPFSGFLSSNQSQNPDFFSWNKVRIRYCDGASLSGELEDEVQGYGLFFRGQRIWRAIMDELLLKGLANAQKALLSGCSAGGLATFIHCDDFRALLPKGVTVKCLADGGFFLDEKDVSGKRSIRSFYHEVVSMQGVSKNLRKDCVSRVQPSQCFFPQEFITGIETPIFIVNSAYDWWQIQNILAPDDADPHNDWLKCKQDIYNCNLDQLKVLHEYRSSMLDALEPFQHSKNGGMFINSCYAHCQTWKDKTWHSPESPRLNNKTIAEAVGDWYFDRKEVKEIDCPFPCNPSCNNEVFS
ncbi:hypothetical protein AMTRI_Chr08g162640 [Amborella trichopoda]